MAPDLHAFRNLRERDLRREGVCVGEGPYVVERMVASGWTVTGILCSEGLAERGRRIAGAAVPLTVMPERELQETAGYPFHRGMLAAALRPALPGAAEWLRRNPGKSGTPTARTVIAVCPDVGDPENLGSIFRSAAAFGLDAVLLGSRCADPFSRRAIRVSMGGVFSVPLAEIRDRDEVADLLPSLGLSLVGASTSEGAVPLPDVAWPSGIALVFGNENSGIDGFWLERCESAVAIPMPGGSDSLNVGVAAGIFMYAATAGRRLPNGPRTG